MVFIFKKPSKFQSHFTQNQMRNIYSDLTYVNAKSKTVQRLFKM